MFRTMAEVKQANKAAGLHFFSRDTMKFFNSRIESEILRGKYFITSERISTDTPKLYTLRKVLENGRIETVGKMQQFTTKRKAKEYLLNNEWR